MVIGPALTPGSAPVQPGGEEFWFPAPSRTAVLAIHGWTGSPYETRPLGEALAEQGYAVLGIRLPGHGTDPREMHAFGWRDWLDAARQAARDLMADGRNVVVAGQSMGGLLALALGMELRRNPLFRGIVSLASPVWLIGPDVRALGHVRRVWPPGTSLLDIQDPTHRSTLVSYRKVHPKSVLELLELSGMVRRRLPHVTSPILIGQGREDRVVLPGNAQMVYERVRSSDRTLRIYPRSGHIVPLDYDAPAAFEDIAVFVRRVGDGMTI